MFIFRNYKPNAEGFGRGNAKKSMFDPDIEAEAEFDQLDDDGAGDALAQLDDAARARMEAVRERRKRVCEEGIALED